MGELTQYDKPSNNILHANKINGIMHKNVIAMAMKLLDDFVKYVSELTGNSVYPRVLSEEKRNRLPIFLSRSYSLYTATIMGRDYLILIHERGDYPTPARAETHAETIKNSLGEQPVFVFARLDAFVRDRLIKRRVPFAIPYQHIFLPMALVDSREQSQRSSPDEIAPDVVSAPAQVLLLYHLLGIGDTEHWPLKHWADVLSYSPMSISRAWKELAAHDLCSALDEGRALVLRFPKSSRETWKRALRILQNPVRHRTAATIDDPDSLRILRAGITALAERTLISGGGRGTVAMAMREWSAALDNKLAHRASRFDENSMFIEAWRYDPAVLSPEEDIVDPLSLYLSLRGDPDERIQGALEDMIDEFQWPT